MKLLTNEKLQSYQNTNICYICKEKLQDKHAQDKKHHKAKDHGHYREEWRDAAYDIRNLSM